MMKAVIYARYSSDKQDADSIEAQLRACREYASGMGYDIVGTYVDEAISGKGSKTASRKQYQKMLRDAETRQFESILIHKYDRVARNVGEHVNLEMRLSAWGVALIAVAQDFGTSKEAKIMRTLTWAMSEYYIDNLSEEVKKGHKETALKGLHNGGYAPFGYDVVNQEYLVNELEAGYVRKIFDSALNKRGFTEVIDEMAARGVVGKRGKPIKYTQIYEMLRNEKYTGAYIYSTKMEKTREERRGKPNAIRIENALPAIISREQFEEVQRIMHERKQTGAKAGYLCSGLVYCNCGAKMHGITTSRKGHSYSRYYCSAKCGAPTVRMEDVDTAALEYLRELLADDNQVKIAQAMRQYQGGAKNRAEDFQAVLRSKIAEKQDQYDTLLKNLSTGVLPAAVVADMGQRMQELKAEIEALGQTTPPPDYTVDQIKTWLASIESAPDEKAVHMLIDRIDVDTKNTTAISISSTLMAVVGETGRGDTQHSFPTILFRFNYRR